MKEQIIRILVIRILARYYPNFANIENVANDIAAVIEERMPTMPNEIYIKQVAEDYASNKGTRPINERDYNSFILGIKWFRSRMKGESK